MGAVLDGCSSRWVQFSMGAVLDGCSSRWVQFSMGAVLGCVAGPQLLAQDGNSRWPWYVQLHLNFNWYIHTMTQGALK